MARITELMEQRAQVLEAAALLRKTAEAQKASVAHKAEAAASAPAALDLDRVRDTLDALVGCNLVKKAEAAAAMDAIGKDPNELLNVMNFVGEQTLALQDLAAEKPIGWLVEKKAGSEQTSRTQEKARNGYAELGRRIQSMQAAK